MILGAILLGGFFDASRLPDDLLTEFRRVGRRCGYSAVMRSLFAAMPSFVAAQDLYGHVSVLTTLVYSDKDWAKQEERNCNHEAIKDSTRITLENTGHFASLKRPEAVAQVILAGQV
jgi:pimeloyl-ACP methyl ester carboxylesterase